MSAPVQPPRRLAFLTVPLLMSLIYNCISLFTLPFSQDTLYHSYEQMGTMYKEMGMTLPELTPELARMALWIAFGFTAALVFWLDYTRRAIQARREAGRISGIVLGILSLLIIPFGTILGIFMLIGAFDKDVKNYFQ